MNLKNSLFAIALIFSSGALAHNHHDSTKQELLVVLIHDEKRIENLEKQVECLKAALAHCKHKFDEKHQIHELYKAYEHLKQAMS